MQRCRGSGHLNAEAQRRRDAEVPDILTQRRRGAETQRFRTGLKGRGERGEGRGERGEREGRGERGE
jgi:hypothetical protein